MQLFSPSHSPGRTPTVCASGPRMMVLVLGSRVAAKERTLSQRKHNPFGNLFWYSGKVLDDSFRVYLKRYLRKLKILQVKILAER
jgi:hypothetical protein